MGTHDEECSFYDSDFAHQSKIEDYLQKFAILSDSIESSDLFNLMKQTGFLSKDVLKQEDGAQKVVGYVKDSFRQKNAIIGSRFRSIHVDHFDSDIQHGDTTSVNYFAKINETKQVSDIGSIQEDHIILQISDYHLKQERADFIKMEIVNELDLHRKQIDSLPPKGENSTETGKRHKEAKDIPKIINVEFDKQVIDPRGETESERKRTKLNNGKYHRR